VVQLDTGAQAAVVIPPTRGAGISTRVVREGENWRDTITVAR